jgi:hypothetical protein
MPHAWTPADFVFNAFAFVVMAGIAIAPRRVLGFIFRSRAVGLSAERIGALRALAGLVAIGLVIDFVVSLLHR